MLRRLLRHDWRTLRADFAVWAIAAVFGAALAYGLYNGGSWAGGLRRAVDAARHEERTRLAELQDEAVRLEREGGQVSPFRDPRNPSTLGQSRAGRYAVLPPTPLAALSIGQSDLLPSYYRMSTDSREMVLAATEIENPQTLLTGRFDLSFVIIYLYPLLILALSYNILSVEMEQGTLPLALSQPVALNSIVQAKVLLRGGLMIGFALVVCVCGLLVANVPLWLGENWIRIALWTAVVGAYGALWFAIAVLVAAFGRPSATNAMTVAGVWLLLVLLVPAAINLVVTTVYPVPSRVGMIQAVRVASDEASAEGSKLLARYYEDHPELAGDRSEKAMTDFSIIRVAVSAEVERRMRPVLEQYDRQLLAQHHSVRWLRYLSPAVVAQDALNDLAGTGVARHRRFVALVEVYHREWRDFFVPLIFQRASVTRHDAIPQFRYVEEPLGDLAVRAGVCLTALVMPTTVVVFVGLRRLRRLPVVG